MFQESFKYYKSKWPVPDFAEVIDVDLPNPTVRENIKSRLHLNLRGTLSLNLRTSNFSKVREFDLGENALSCTLPLGMQPAATWQCYTLTHAEGLILVRNAFTTQGQRYWMTRCLRDYPKEPNVVNLNSRLFADTVLEDWWRELQQCADKDEARRMKISMRWTTLGYHHDWDTKVYSDKKRNAFPSDLGKMCKIFSTVLGFEGFEAQAAIVNYYPIGTTLAGHTDHSEVNLNAPLFSFSFGQTAIFLIGGRTKGEKPTALFLQSGDVLVMSRVARLCYHAVPRVMKARDEPWNEVIEQREYSTTRPQAKKPKIEYVCAPSECGIDEALYQQVADEVFWAPFKNFMSDSRININVRQVLEDNQTRLPQQ